MKKVLILVPHQDDDIILCGGFLKGLIEKEYQVFVVYMTNGDSDSQIGYVRMKEALKAMELYGIPETQVIFMGYANQYMSKYSHIYNAGPDEIVASRFGNTKTYGLIEHPEYCYQRYGIHHLYQRKNLIGDLKEIILEILPDIIMATDVEMHVDHIANSLFLDEVIGDLFKSHSDFRPIIYKKQGYATDWYSIADYNAINNAATKENNQYSYVNHEVTDFLNPYIRWIDRIRFPLHISARTEHKEDNIVYKALQIYSSQNAIEHFDSILNSDSVFWKRRTDSVSYTAIISATSGNTSYINDFKIFDCSRIAHANKWCIDASIWRPEQGDLTPAIVFELDKEIDISKVIIYQEFCPKSEILCSALIFDGADRVEIGRLETRKATIVCFEPRRAKKVEYIIEKCSNSMENIGISEIELYRDYNPKLSKIKIMIDDNFIYDYFVDSSLNGKVGIYQIFNDGSAGTSLNMDEYELSLTDSRGTGKDQYIHDYRLSGVMKEDKLILRAFAKIDMSICDEVMLIKKEIQKISDSVNPYKEKHLLLKWLILKQDKVSIRKYFLMNLYATVAIYGLGELGVRVLRELQDSGVEIKYVVDKNAACVSTCFPIYMPDDELEKVDVMVVTAMRHFKKIEEQMSGKLHCPIVSIKDIIDSLS